MSEASAESLKKTPLYNLHLAQGAKMVPFAGYEMPVQYPSGVKTEHLHTRNKAGVFDVSHMGQLTLSGDGADHFLESLVPVDIVDLPVGKQRYALFTNEAGGILDDLMVTRYDDCLYLVVNAACKEQDIQHLQAHLPDGVTLERLNDRALIAIQGPMAVDVMHRLIPEVADMVFMDSRQLSIDGVPCFISRSGYTGEDGFEISIPEKEAERITRLLLDHPEVELIGLGARDSLRLESGLCLYGHDIDVNTTPVEASLIWAISKNRRHDGERAGGFPGAEMILKQIETKQVETKRIGLIGSSRAPVREGADLVDEQGQSIGRVTSGTFGPSVESPVAMALINANYATLGTEVYALVRGKKLPMTVSKMPFIEQRYYRG
ncbi:glycine cleavage system aminomethyltransferase GcvT [Endozoicomonas elysicola]|uniref:aminomethyltransferase n=1 Tax=Endozoicomonas elysicola TaxID=305900 RepID=A0A081KDA3_9GAMM|nr:glycine cleavage system aminomethyltransferase GcvT [Endozoicomonas elysicola]KEI72129.1 glycine cleavage system protein T [Endozoicomonas elysicola]